MKIEIHPESKQRFRPGKFSMSAADDCDRKISAEYLAIPYTNQVPNRIARTFGLGNAIEDLVLKWMAERGIKVIAHLDGKQIELTADNPAQTGHLDSMALLWGEYIPIDVKSMHSGWARKTKSGSVNRAGFAGLCDSLGVSVRSFEDLVVFQPREGGYAKGLYGIRSENPKYYAQAQFYMHYGRELDTEEWPTQTDPINWDKFAFVCFDKDSSKMLIEVITYDEPFVRDRLVRLRQIEEAAQKEALIVIPKGYAADKFPCKNCPYHDMCWEGIDAQDSNR